MAWPFLLLLLLLVALPSAQGTVSIYNDSKIYRYYGCYNETTQIPGSAEVRALAGGIDESKPGQMTVPICLGFCGNGATKYRYAGLEWSRECWCSQTLSGIAEKLDDGACNHSCEGENTMACGGSLKLSVYRVASDSALTAPGLMMAFSGVAVAFWLSR